MVYCTAMPKQKQILQRYQDLTRFIQDKKEIETLLLCMYQLTPT